MAAVPTFRIKHRVTNEVMTVNQSDYHSAFAVGSGRFRAINAGGDWEIVSQDYSGGDEGYQESKKMIDTLVNLELKREVDGLGRK